MPRSNLPLMMVPAVFLSFVTLAIAAGTLPFAVLGFYLAASTVAFSAYALDKSAARRGRWRTPEISLHLMALVGGWPGAMAAQELLRHKSRKLSFRIWFWVTVVFNCAVLGWLVSPAAAGVCRVLRRLAA